LGEDTYFMLNLGHSHSARDNSDPHFLHGALPPGLSRDAFAAFDPWDYENDSLELGRASWEQRLLDERQSQVTFSELLAQLTNLGLALDVLGSAVQLVRDEGRHVELCRRMVAVLGGRGHLREERHPVRSDPSVPLLRSVVRTVVSSLCVVETFSMRMLAAARETTEDWLAREVITCLAADEAEHSRFGWRLLSQLLPLLSEEEREESVSTLPELLEESEQKLLIPEWGFPEYESPFPAGLFVTAPLHPFGFLPQKVRNQVFHDTLECDILDRFELLGLAVR
jgi:hypothetical protein